jgi:hypothetical protein
VSPASGQPCDPTSTAARCGALAFAYAIGADSVPLAGVQVTELDPASAQHVHVSVPDSGGVVLGSGLPGAYTWLFSATGFVPVFRSADLTAAHVTWIGVPRLAPLTDIEFVADTFGASGADAFSRVRLSFPAGSVSGPTTINAAVLDGQSLPGYLPLGYSPIGALWYTADSALNSSPHASFALPTTLGAAAAQPALLAHWDVAQSAWTHAADIAITGTATTVAVTPGAPGGYAVLVADPAPTAPPAVAIGAVLLDATAAFDPTTLSASGLANPAVQVQSLVASAVTAQAQIWLKTPATPLPSGLVLPSKLIEGYLFAGSSTTSNVPTVDLATAFYRYPPLDGAPAGALAARFPIRPRYLLDGADVTQSIALSASEDFDGAPIDATGGSIARDGIAVTVPAGAFTNPTLVQVSGLPNAGLTLDGVAAASAFELSWSGDALSAGSRLTVDVGLVRPNGEYVLAKRMLSPNGYLPVERFTSNTNGQLTSLEPTSGPRLPGITSAGTYALFPVAVREGLVQGTAVDSNSAPLSGIVVQVATRPWVDATDATGTFALLGRPGSITVEASRPGTTDNGIATGTLPDAASVLSVNVIVAQTAPQIVSVSPHPGATNVPLVSAVELVFSEPISLASLAASNAVQVLTSTGAAVAGSLSISPNRMTVDFLSTKPLSYGTTYTVVASAGLTDDAGRTLAGGRSSTFSTVPAPAQGAVSARLTSYAPGSSKSPCSPYDPAQVTPDFDPTGQSFGSPGFDPTNLNLVCIVGSAGVADPTSPVVIVDDDSGVAVTVVSQPNGSFKSYIAAREDDLLSAVTINSNGTRFTIPLEREKYDDGRVALFASGGTVDAPNPLGGQPLQISIPAGSIARRGVFTFVPKTATDTVNLFGASATDGRVLVGATVQYTGDPLTQRTELSIPIAPSQLQLPAGTSTNTAGFVLARANMQQVNGQQVPSYEVIDRMQYASGALGTHSWPEPGLLGEDTIAVSGIWILAAMVVPDLPTVFTGYVLACQQQAPGSAPSPCNAAGTALQLNPSPQSLDVIANTPGGPQAFGGRRLPGAVVYVTSANPPSLAPGGFVAVADETGRYSLAVPIGANVTAGFGGNLMTTFIARYPDFSTPAANSVNTADLIPGVIMAKHLIFSEAVPLGAINGGPSVSVIHRPQYPGVGNVADPSTVDPTNPVDPPVGAIVIVTARSNGSELPTIPSPTVVSATALVPGQPNPVIATPFPAIGPRLQDTIFNRVTQAFLVTSPVAARVQLDAQANTISFGTGDAADVIYFGGASNAVVNPSPPPDPTPGVGPIVIRTVPAPNSTGVSTIDALQFQFNKPVQLASTANDFVLSAGGVPVQTNPPGLAMSPDGLSLYVSFPSLLTGTTYTLTFGSNSIFDLSGTPYGKNTGSSNFSFTFTTDAESATTLTPAGESDMLGVTEQA